MSFIEDFTKLPVEEKKEFLEKHRQVIIRANPDDYVSIPMLMPKQSALAPEKGAYDFTVNWIVGAPGVLDHPIDNTKQGRIPIMMLFPSEETCDDFKSVLNEAKNKRVAK